MKSYQIVFMICTLILLMASMPRYGLTDEEVRLIREVEEIKYKIEHTEWTWFNRDEKKAYVEMADREDRMAVG